MPHFHLSALLGIAASFCVTAAFAASATLAKEPPQGQLACGVKVLVDDGSCPTGQILQVSGGCSNNSVAGRRRDCVKRR